MVGVRHRNPNRKRLGLVKRLNIWISSLNRRSWIAKRIKMRLGKRYASDLAKFLQLLGMRILGSRNVWIERINAATVEDSEKGVIEWMYAEVTACTMDRGSDDGLCAEFSAEAEFSDGYAYVKFSKLGFHSVLDLVGDSHSNQS